MHAEVVYVVRILRQVLLTNDRVGCFILLDNEFVPTFRGSALLSSSG